MAKIARKLRGSLFRSSAIGSTINRMLLKGIIPERTDKTELRFCVFSFENCLSLSRKEIHFLGAAKWKHLIGCILAPKRRSDVVTLTAGCHLEDKRGAYVGN